LIPKTFIIFTYTYNVISLYSIYSLILFNKDTDSFSQEMAAWSTSLRTTLVKVSANISYTDSPLRLKYSKQASFTIPGALPGNLPMKWSTLSFGPTGKSELRSYAKDLKPPNSRS
jgi:hypothetical protein